MTVSTTAAMAVPRLKTGAVQTVLLLTLTKQRQLDSNDIPMAAWMAMLMVFRMAI